MKKLVIPILIIITMCFSVFALTLSNPTPASGSKIQGNSSEYFEINGDTNMTNGYLVIDGVVQSPALTCSGTVCYGYYDLTSKSEGLHTFYFSVDGVNSQTYNFTIDRTPPQPVTVLSAVNEPNTEGTITLTWQQNIDSDFNHYNIYYSTSNFTDVSNATFYTSVNQQTTTSINVSGLTDGITYYFAVTAVDDVGNENTTVSTVAGASQDNYPPPQVQNVIITQLNDSSLYLEWSPATDAVYYIINRSTTSGGPYTNIANTSNTNYTDTGLTAGTTYYYVIQAVDDGNNTGQPSNEVSSTVVDVTPPNPPTFNPPSGSTVYTSDVQVNVSYDEILQRLAVWIGGVWQYYYDIQNLTLNLTGLTSGTHTYYFNATDYSNNSRLDSYELNVNLGGQGNVSINITGITVNIEDAWAEKGNALSNGYDWVILAYKVYMYGGEFLRVRMSDLTNGFDTIQINSVNTTAFCKDDYDSIAQDIVSNPGFNVYRIYNNWDETQPALNCLNDDGTVNIEGDNDWEGNYTVYIKIPIPANLGSGSYYGTIDFGAYPTITI